MNVQWYHVRTADIHHIESATQMVCAYYRCSNAISLEQYDFNYDINSMENTFQQMIPQFQRDHGGALILLVIDGVAEGFAGFLRHSTTCAEIRYLYVKPDKRKQGYGSSLLEQLLHEARSQNYEEISIVTPRFMRNAYHLLEKTHFTEVKAHTKSETPSPFSEMFHTMVRSL